MARRRSTRCSKRVTRPSPYAMAGLPIGEEMQAENEKRLNMDLDSNFLTASTTDSSYSMPQRLAFFPSLF